MVHIDVPSGCRCLVFCRLCLVFGGHWCSRVCR